MNEYYNTGNECNFWNRKYQSKRTFKNDTGYVTEFRYTRNVFWAVQDYSRFDSIASDSAMARSDRALIFVDNHDTQRNGTFLCYCHLLFNCCDNILSKHLDVNASSYKNPREYKQAVAYTLAQVIY